MTEKNKYVAQTGIVQRFLEQSVPKSSHSKMEEFEDGIIQGYYHEILFAPPALHGRWKTSQNMPACKLVKILFRYIHVRHRMVSALCMLHEFRIERKVDEIKVNSISHQMIPQH